MLVLSNLFELQEDKTGACWISSDKCCSCVGWVSNNHALNSIFETWTPITSLTVLWVVLVWLKTITFGPSDFDFRDNGWQARNCAI
jgi:hypothetical protein